MRLLVTGFGPFPGAARNPAGPVAMGIARRLKAPVVVLPTEYVGAEASLLAALAAHRPEALLMIGLAGRDPRLRVERFATNVTGRLRPDQARRFFASRAIAPGAPRWKATPARTEAIQARLVRNGHPARVSLSAGDYLCNFAYWRALEAVERGALKTALFLHIPRPRAALTPKKRAKGRRPTLARLIQAGVVAARTLDRR